MSDVELPLSIVQRILKEALPTLQMSKEAKGAFQQAASIFISYIAQG